MHGSEFVTNICSDVDDVAAWTQVWHIVIRYLLNRHIRRDVGGVINQSEDLSSSDSLNLFLNDCETNNVA